LELFGDLNRRIDKYEKRQNCLTEHAGPVIKPPLGITPKDIANLQRRIERYQEANKTVPVEWLYELKDLYLVE